MTIVIPVFKTEAYLEKCLSSLLVAGWQDRLDVVVVIDGSPDRSAEIARRYEAQYPGTFRVVEKENGGHGSCWNVGLRMAEGRYVRFLDSDDWFDTPAFATFLAHLATAEADVVFTNYAREYVFEGRTEPCYAGGVEYGRVYDAKTFDYATQPVTLCSLFAGTYSTAMLRAEGVRFTEKAYYDDTILQAYGFMSARSFVFLEPLVYRYFIGRPGQTMSVEARMKHLAHAQRETLRLCAVYEERAAALAPAKRDFLFRVAAVNVDEKYRILLNLPYREARRQIRSWDEQLARYVFRDRLYAEGGKLMVQGSNLIDNEQVVIQSDLVVLATAIEPEPSVRKVATLLTASIDTNNFLNESHPKLRPVESPTAGVYLAGVCQGPKDIPETVSQASACAAKVIGLLVKDRLKTNPCVAHPDESMCNGCSQCANVCAYGAITYVDKEFRLGGGKTETRRVASVNPAVCQGCGACTVTCPSGAMDLSGFSSSQIMSEVEAICKK